MPLSPMDIYKLLNRSNCSECGSPTCMAFALSVVAGEKDILACPYLSPEEAERLAPLVSKRLSQEGFSASIIDLRERFLKLDLATLPQRLGADYSDGKLRIECLGKDFVLNEMGRMESFCHVNAWMETLLLSYCLATGTGVLSGRWSSFSELDGAATTGPYFRQRCEVPLQAIADTHGGIFFDLLKLFGAESAPGFSADRALLIRPLPRVPMVISYSAPEDEMESTLRVLFDSTATEYLGPEVITFMGRGMVEMFQKIISKHEGCMPDLLSL